MRHLVFSVRIHSAVVEVLLCLLNWIYLKAKRERFFSINNFIPQMLENSQELGQAKARGQNSWQEPSI